MSEDNKARLAGLVSVTAAIAIFKLAYVDVLEKARWHASHVSKSSYLAVAPLLFVLGLVYVVHGKPSSTGWFARLKHGDRLSPLGWAVVAVLVAPGLALYIGLDVHLSALGYR